MEKKQTEESTGRSLLVYLLPVIVVGVLLLLATGIYAQFVINDKIVKQNKVAIVDAATGLAERLKSMVDSRREVIQVLTRIDGLAEVITIADDEQVQRKFFADYLKRLLPNIQHIEIIAVGQEQSVISNDSSMGYASLDLINRAIEKGNTPLVEVHQLRSKKPYIAIASAIESNGEAVGALLAGYSLKILRQQVDVVTHYPGSVQVVQGDGDDAFILANSVDLVTGKGDGEVHVPGTLMRVRYQAESVVSSMLVTVPLIIAIIGIAIVLLIAVGLLQIKLLSRDLRDDMGSVLTLVNALLKRSGAPQPKPRLKDVAPAICLLGRYAQTVYSNTTQKEGHDKQQEVPVIEPTSQLFGDALPTPEDSTSLAEMPNHIFRAYDIRGITGPDLTSEMSELLGMGVGSLALESDQSMVYVAQDSRLSSPDLTQNLIEGILTTGCNVCDLGAIPTPLINFAMHEGNSKSGVMVTASHNAPEYNGFKIVINGETVIEQALSALHHKVVNGDFLVGQGKRETLDIKPLYVEKIAEEVQLGEQLKVVVDAGNGIAGPVAVQSLTSIGCEVLQLNCEPDGKFPNHHPDPSQPKNMQQLIAAVKQNSADIGLAFDGDGDRIGVVDELGNIISTDLLLMLLADNVLTSNPGIDVIYDVKSSRSLASFILSHGGRPIMWKSGYTRIKAKMEETGALIGGEFSGHIFLKDRWYGFDDAIYAAARVLEILAFSNDKASTVFSGLPSSYSSQEYYLDLAEGESESVMALLSTSANFEKANIIDLDGLRVEFPNSWGLVKSSNTMPALVFRFEGDNEAALNNVKEKFQVLMTAVLPNAVMPF